MVFLLLALPAYATEVQEVSASNGVTAWLVEDHSLPMFSLRLAFRQAGGAYDPDDAQGTALLASRLLTEGSGEMDAKTYHETLDGLAIDLDFSITHDVLSGSLKSLSENRAQAFNLLAQALAAPRMDKEAVERIRQEALAEHQMLDERATHRATIAYQQQIFAGHPYAHRLRGTPESLRTITAQELTRYVRNHLTRDRLVLAVAGDITAAELKTLLENAFAGLPSTAVPVTPPEPTTPQLPQSTLTEIIPMQTPQTAVVFGTGGIARDDPRFYAYYVMQHMLGGNTLTSRLGTAIRKERGLAYYAYVRPEIYRSAALLEGAFASRNEEAAEATQVLREVFRHAQEEGFGKEEVDAAKRYLTGSFVLRLDASNSLANYLLSMQLYHLGRDYLDARNNYIEAVTPEEVNTLTSQLLDPNHLTIVAAGGMEASN